MPCDTIELANVDLGKMNERLLGRALEALGARGITLRNGQSWFILDGIRCEIRNGRLLVPQGSEHLADKLKREYGREVVKYTAQRNGWKLTETKPFVFAVTK
jgi:hypothetical protein